MKLYVVKITHEVVVRAADAEQAQKVAAGIELGDLHDGEEVVLGEIRRRSQVPQGWLLAIPFADGPTGAATVAQILQDHEREVIESGRTHFFGDGCDPPHGVAASQP